MHRADVESAVSAWVAEATRRATVQNDAAFQMVLSARQLTRLGQMPEGDEHSPSGPEQWRVTLELWFPEHGPLDEPSDPGLAIARVLDAMQESADEDPTLAGRVQHARWRGTLGSQAEEPGTGPEGFPLRVEAYMVLQTTAGT